MALYPPPAAAAIAAKEDKLIFAPSPDTPLSSASSAQGSGKPARAGQFLKSETRGGLRLTDLDLRDPITQFHKWFSEAKAAGVAHPETCTLSTASLPSGRVSARMVYLKELDRQGFVLYSNFGTSRKAADLFGLGDSSSTGNPWAALTFWWEPLERQVRVEGRAARLTAAESQVYFDTRVRGSRIGAWASRQSAVLVPDATVPGDDGRAQLNGWVAETEARFGKGSASGDNDGGDDGNNDSPIPVPEFWGGLRIVPERVEFWQGRQNRLHDRFAYDRCSEPDKEKGQDASWTLNRLSP